MVIPENQTDPFQSLRTEHLATWQPNNTGGGEQTPKSHLKDNACQWEPENICEGKLQDFDNLKKSVILPSSELVH